MKPFFARLAHLNLRTKTLLAVASVALLVVVVAGALLTLNPPLAARLGRALPGAVTVNSSGPIKYGSQCLTVTTEWLWQPGKYQVRMWECDPSNPPTQQWKYVTDSQGYIIAHSPLNEEVCLDVEGASKAEGATITTYPCTRGAGNEDWNILGLGFLDQVTGSGIKFQNENSKLCMTHVGGMHPYMVQVSCDSVGASWTWPPNY
jgi:hypothetical protein